MRAFLFLAAVAVVLAIAQAGSSASHPVGYYCSPGSPGLIFSNFPIDGVSTANGAAGGPAFATNGPYCVDTIETSHVGGDPGPGTNGLAPGGGALTGQGGPWAITAANGIWTSQPSSGNDTAVINGTYTCTDSNPSTWTYVASDASKTGFCRVSGRPALVDATPPTVSFDSPTTGSVVGGAVAFHVTASDQPSGIDRVDVQTSTPTPGSWTTRASGSASSVSWDTTKVADGAYSVRLAAFDVAGNETDTAAISLTVDNTPPPLAVQCDTGSGPTACASGYYTKAVDVTAASDGSPITYTVDSPLGSATAYSGPIHVTASHTYYFSASDTVGNLASKQVAVLIDMTAPPAPSVALGQSNGAYLRHAGVNAYTLYHRSAVAGSAQLVVPAGDDPESGVASVSFPAALGLTTWHTSSVNARDATYAWDTSPGEPAAFEIASTNGAGMTGAASTVSFAADDTAPSLSVTCSPVACSNPTGPVTITASASDAVGGSGLADVRYTTDGSVPTATTGTSATTVTLTHAPATITFAAFDNVGNTTTAPLISVTQASAGIGTFTVDTTNDTSDATNGDGVCADTAGACSLRAAVQEANALPAGSKIFVPKGSYPLSSGALLVQTGMTITGDGARSTTLIAASGARVFDVAATANPVRIVGLTLTGGTATDAAGFFGGDIRSAGNVTLSEDTITNGSASSGGGVANAGGTMLIERSTIVGNHALTGGGDSGGVQDWGDGIHHGALTIEDSTVTGNTARLGGGVFAWNDAANTVTIRDSTIAGNTGGDRGIGGVGVADGAAGTVSNSVIANNIVGASTSNCGPTTGSSTITSLGHNLESGNDCLFTGASDIRNTNPNLGSLQNNGGPTDTMLPSGGSALVDNGDDASCPAVDQRGTTRPQGSHCDIGAVESAQRSFVVTNISDAGAGSLRQAILDADAYGGPASVTFAIPGGGAHVIAPQSPLPPVTAPVTIDGYTQPGAQPATQAPGDPTDAVLNVVINGDNVNVGAGLEVTGTGATIRGLVVNGGFNYGVELDGVSSTNNTVVGNYIGTNAAGTAANGLRIYGVLIANGASNNRIGSLAAGDRNVISGTTGISPGGGVGVGLALGAHNNLLLGNLIGTSASGTENVPNATGVLVLSAATNNQIGAGKRGSGNTITGNSGPGVRLQQGDTSGNVVSGNFIGVTWLLANGQKIDSGNGGDGVQVVESASGNRISDNTIANNGGNGVGVVGASGITISSNSIRNSGKLGIDLDENGITANDAGDGDSGANGLQNFPVITDVSSDGTVIGTLNSTPSSTFTVEVFGNSACNASGNGEGIGPAGRISITTDTNGNGVFTLPASLAPTAAYVTATATDAGGSTSEFSSCFKLTQTGGVLTVNTADDHTDAAGCSAGDCSLREAINAADASAQPMSIRFAILTGPQAIHLRSPLPPIGRGITVDGTSQPGWLAAPIITLDGSGITFPGVAFPGPVDGVRVEGAGATVRGLVVDGFTGIGIHVLADGATIAGNYSGITAGGALAARNGGDGIRIEAPVAGTANNVTVGGTSPLDRNVVGGNGGHGIFLVRTQNATVRGNYSGIDAGGTTAIGNGIDGIAVDGGSANTIVANLSSGNTNQGISMFDAASSNVVRGNTVGTNAARTANVGNGGDGIRVDVGSNNVIGGTGAGQGNVVRGSGLSGVGIYNEGSGANTISGNSISGNGSGILLHDFSNGGQGAPTVMSADAAHVAGALAAAANATYTIEVFQNATTDCEGQSYVGSTQATTDGNGNATWSLAGAVDPGSYLSATATSAAGNTSQFSACFQLQNSTALFATVSVDQSSTSAGASSFPIDGLPPQLFTQLATGDPSSAPIPSAPIPSAAVGAAPIPSAPIPSAPIPSAPIPSAPIPSAPIPSAPIPSAPIPSAPIPSAGLQGLPIPSAGTQNPLDAILLSSLPGLDVNALFAGTSIAGKLPQQYTLGDVYRTPSAYAYLQAHYTAADLNLSSTLLRGVRTLSYLLGDKTLDHITLPGGQTWCTALANAGGSCANAVASQTTVIGLDMMGQLGTLDLGHLTVVNLLPGTNGSPFDDTLVGNAYLARIAFQKTRIAQIATSLVPSAVTCSPAVCPTLGDAAKQNAVRDGVKLSDLGTALNNITLNELVVAMTPPNALPWEQESFLGWQGFGGQAQQLTYHVDFDAVCPINGLSVRVTLPYGFVYVPGSSTVQIGAAAAGPAGDPTLDPKTGATWVSIPTVACPSSGSTQHVRLNFQGEAGYRLGASLSTAVVTAAGVSTKVTGAPVLVNRTSFGTNALSRSTEPQLGADTIYLSHVDSAGGTNYFKFPELGRGKQVTIYMRPPAGSDFDLYVVRPAPASVLASPIPSAPIPSAPIPSAPIPSAPIPSADTSVNTTTDNPAPELSDDGPLLGGQVAVDSITRGDGVESVTFRQAGNTGFDEIAVAGYNGASSSDPFELRVQVQDPPPLPQQCPARNLATGTPGTLPVGIDPGTQNLALVNVSRLNAMYPGQTTQLLADLNTVFSLQNHGAVIPVDGDAGVRSAASAWDQNPCSIDAANNYVKAINTVVAGYRANLTNLQSITVVGNDEQIPFARVADFVPTSSEFDNAASLAFLLGTNNGVNDNATYAAAAQGYVLTDDAYGAFHTRTLFGHEFFLPEVALGRLVETPAEIDAQLTQYAANNGQLSPKTGFVTGYDFMSDGSKAVDDGLSKRIGTAPSSTNTLLRDTWGKSALQTILNGTTSASDIGSWNAHYDFRRLMPAVYTGPSDLLATDVVPSGVSQQFAGRIFFTMGCHAGESIADTLFANLAKTRDWAQTYSQTGAAVFIGNTGFGYGDTASVALSERLMSIFAGHLAFNGSVGEKLMQSKNEYFASMGAYGSYDEKAIEEATFYGLPFWQVNSPTEATPTPPATQPDTGSTGLTVAPMTITPQLTKVADARGTFWSGGDGVVFVPGRAVQPLSTFDVTQPASSALVAHGFFPSDLVTDDSNKGLNLYFAKPMIDQASHEPEPRVTNDVFPASPVKMAQIDYLGQRHSTLDVIDGQSRPGSSPSLQNERLITNLKGVVTYAPASATDYTPPLFGQTGAVVTGGAATIFATVTDNASAGVIRVRAFYTTGGAWQFVDLQPTGQGNAWQAVQTLPAGVDKIETGFVAEDATGNTAWMTGKGILVDSYTPATAPSASIMIKQPLDGGTYLVGQSVTANYTCADTILLTGCAGPVANGGPINTQTVGPNPFTVTATPIAGTSTSKTATYTVVYNFGGFQSPIAPNALNVVKAGSTVPVKFSLHGNFGLGILAAGFPESGTIPCTGGTVDTGLTTTTPGNSSLSYDASSDTYTYSWQTQKPWANTCRQLLVETSDGVVRRANFQFK